MTEEKKKNRGWVKDVAIVFLVILLILTFFSQTIMNWSLPEVAIQYVNSGTISAQIRGTATVKATETYEVVLDESRKVKTVFAKVGDSVEIGDLLFVLAEGDSEELEAAKEQLDALQLSYKKALLQAATYDYARDNRAISQLREQIEEKTNEKNAVDLSDEPVTAAKQAVADAQQTVADAEIALDEADTQLKAAQQAVEDKNTKIAELQEERNQYSTGTGDTSGIDAAQIQLSLAEDKVAEAENALKTAQLLYGTYYDAVDAAAREWIAADYDAEHPVLDEEGNPVEGESAFAALSENDQALIYHDRLPSYLPAAAEKIRAEGDTTTYNGYKAVVDAEADVASAKQAYEQAQLNYSNAWDMYYNANSGNGQFNKLTKEIKDEQEKLKTLTAALDSAQKAQKARTDELTKANEALADAKTKQSEAETDLKTRKAEADSLAAEIKTLQNNLEDSLFNLAQQQHQDSVSKQLQELDLAEQKKQITELEEKIAKMEGGENAGAEIYSDVAGVVKSVNISSGNTTQPKTALATIEVPDRGYTAELSVTNEQAQKVNVGDNADISTGWWRSVDITARLVAIRPDPQNARTNKLLVFDLTGSDVESGANLTLSIGERSRSFDTVVPKSALRSDSNGDFVLMIVAKQSPLGNRYIAQRIDVTKVAEDDMNVAISGGISQNDCVITTSTAPVESGMQVRMAEG